MDPFDEWAVAAVERKKKKEKYELAETCEPSGVKHVQKISV